MPAHRNNRWREEIAETWPHVAEYLGDWMRRIGKNPLTAIGAAIAVVSLFFLLFPSFDIAVSAIFYDQSAGFFAQQNAFLKRLRELGPFLVRLVAVISIAAILVRLFLPTIREKVDLRAPLFLLTSLALGPGLLVNAILKDNWGRARPRHVDIFGGDAPYTSVWQIADNCQRNCSFTSGEASSATWLFALVFLAPKTWRLPMAVSIGGLALALSLNRVAFGGHFLSDTMLSWLLTIGVVVLVHRLMYLRPPSVLERGSLDDGADWLGGRLTALGVAVLSGLRGVWSDLSRHLK